MPTISIFGIKKKKSNKEFKGKIIEIRIQNNFVAGKHLLISIKSNGIDGQEPDYFIIDKEVESFYKT